MGNMHCNVVLDANPAFDVSRGNPRKVLIDMAVCRTYWIHGDLQSAFRRARRRTQAAVPRCEISLLKKKREDTLYVY
jgi:hypothetical protein